MPLSHNSPVLTASCQMLMAVYRPGGICWHRHISPTTMFYMPRKCTLIRLCLELASAMSLVGCALPSLHLSPTLCLPCQGPLTCLMSHMGHSLGSFHLAHESHLRGAVVGWLPGLHLGNAQPLVCITANPELSPQHLGSKHLWTCTRKFSTVAVEQLELKWWQELGDLCRKLWSGAWAKWWEANRDPVKCLHSAFRFHNLSYAQLMEAWMGACEKYISRTLTCCWHTPMRY